MNRLEKMETIDYHGYTVTQALSDLERRIFTVQNDDNMFTFKIITGRGKIREEVINFLDKHDIKWNYELYNDGCIEAIL